MLQDMFGAGSDTSAKTTEWAMSELMRHPEEMKKAQEAVRRVFGENGNVDETRIHELKFLKLVIKETLRLHPPAALLPKECREMTKINGYDIHPKTKVFVNVWAISRDPNTWSAIDYKGNHCEFTPFGSGKRKCPGMVLGTSILELFLAQMLYHFDWKLPDGDQNLDMAESFGATVRRKKDLPFVPVPVHSIPAE